MHQPPLNILQQYWGYSSFRPNQEAIIQSVLDGKDTLALLPTGGGKSICYQVPALCQDGICIVVSPLIALMKDQVFQLKKRKIVAEAIYSGMRKQDIDRILDNCIYGQVKLLYLSPERLTTDIVIERIKKMNVSLLAVDEAHCISQWGYDFRPAYLTIADIRVLIPDTPVLALTATATKEVVQDIQDKLQFAKGQVFESSFERDNLSYVVLQEEGKLAKMLDILTKVKGTAIVYARSRKRTKDIALYLRKNRINADFYHAGLDNDERTKKQDQWINNKTRVIVSTNAFGMGIDKPDVRTVIHVDVPDSPEAYFQEAGRAGRDGEKSYAVLLYRPEDAENLERNHQMSFPDMEVIRRVYMALGSYFQLAVGGGIGDSYDFDIAEFARVYDLDVMLTFSSIKILEQASLLYLSDSVFVPSALRVVVKKETLYDYQLKNRRFDAILKTILRTYQGAFNHMVPIRESQLAKFLNMNTKDLVSGLYTLQKDGIIKYAPRKDKPQLIFLEQRLGKNHLSIDQQLYRFRKERALHRYKSMIIYAEKEQCRSQQLLMYFGQKDAPVCGICDVCLGRNKSELDNVTFTRFKDKIQQLLKREKISVSDLVDSFSPKQRKLVLKTLEYLIDEGFVDQENEQLVWIKK